MGLKKSNKWCINKDMNKIKCFFLLFLISTLFSLEGLSQLYSYKTPSGRILITDRPINKEGYKLVASKKPRNELAVRKNTTGRYSKYQLTQGQIQTLVEPIAKSMDVDPELVRAVIEVESSRNYRVVSKKGAQGLMQLVPDTASRFGVENAFDPRENVEGGVRYLRFLLGYFEGNVDHVLAAYNAGEYAVDKNRGIPPYKETREYIRKVRRLYAAKKHHFDPSITYRSVLIEGTSKPPVRPV